MWLSIQGMYEYNPTIFDGFNVPTGLDKQECINNILLNCAELEIIYTRFETLKTAISTWSYSNQITWQKLYDTMTVEYNPIWNVDADIVETENGARIIDRDNTTSGTDNRTVNLHDNETIDIEDKKSVKGFNETSWAEAEKNDRTGTDNIAHTGTDNRAMSGTESEDVKENTQNTRTQRRTGNIGVTTTQQMLEQERDIARFNMIEYITESFKERFCLLIY